MGPGSPRGERRSLLGIPQGRRLRPAPHHGGGNAGAPPSPGDAFRARVPRPRFRRFRRQASHYRLRARGFGSRRRGHRHRSRVEPRGRMADRQAARAVARRRGASRRAAHRRDACPGEPSRGRQRRRVARPRPDPAGRARRRNRALLDPGHRRRRAGRGDRFAREPAGAGGGGPAAFAPRHRAVVALPQDRERDRRFRLLQHRPRLRVESLAGAPQCRQRRRALCRHQPCGRHPDVHGHSVERHRRRHPGPLPPLREPLLRRQSRSVL